jgi:hypothetical protein
MHNESEVSESAQINETCAVCGSPAPYDWEGTINAGWEPNCYSLGGRGGELLCPGCVRAGSWFNPHWGETLYFSRLTWRVVLHMIWHLAAGGSRLYRYRMEGKARRIARWARKLIER